ncbi:hypothetical protein [Bradyrhizobium sp. Tv2a-2]|uniref:hypothetical protein n=1 Tax=Bradyrhizobium sp. Tv2a-2 TaxID=113395 RepID=UPI0003F95B42|nr:hypothetical protein [Bradyrhizobium sp. Tv2a-2]
MLNKIPLVGWLLAIFFAFCLAVPFWLLWTVFGIGETYAYWLPDVYRHPGFFDCVAIFVVVSILKDVFVPKIVSANNSSSS